MRLIAIHIFRWINEAPVLLCFEQNLNQLWFYQRGMAGEHIKFHTRLIAGRTAPGTKTCVTLEQGVGNCVCWTTNDGISATVITDAEYPEKSAMTMLGKLMLEFREFIAPTGHLKATTDQNLTWPALEKYMQEWQNPLQADKLAAVEKNLIEVNEIMRKNLDDLL